MYDLGKPMLRRAELHVGDKPFVITARNLTDANRYVQSVKLNGQPYDKLYITHQDLLQGGTLEFEMGSQPSAARFEPMVP